MRLGRPLDHRRAAWHRSNTEGFLHRKVRTDRAPHVGSGYDMISFVVSLAPIAEIRFKSDGAMPRPHSITLQDVANAAGVSLMTASNVLSSNRVCRRSDAVARAEKVRAVARKLGYRANTFARAMARGRMGSVALLLSTNKGRSHTPPGLLDGIHDALAEREIQLSVAKLPDEALSQAGAMPRVIRERMSDGLIINYTDHIPQPVIDQIRQYRIPAVWVNAQVEGVCVYPDDLGAGVMGTAHLLGLGHRDIAYVDFLWGWEDLGESHYSVRDRQAGYEQAMRAAGLVPRVVRQRLHVPRAQRWEHLWSLLTGPDRPTAVVLYSATTNLIVDLERQGLRIPHDLSIVAFADSALSESPALTTVLADYGQVGMQAAGQLLEMIQHPRRRRRSIAVPFRITAPEGSCAAPPRGRRRS